MLFIGIIGGVYLVKQQTNLIPKASEPQNSTSSVKYLNSEEVVNKYEVAQSQDPTGIKSPDQIAKALTSSAVPLEDRPNIIFIVADDQNFRHLGIAGNPVLKTPNIDSLANPGIYFNNAYVPLGACSPSRASIWTAKLPHVHGVTQVGKILPEDQITLPEILKANGYSTGFFGKCHLGDPYDPVGYKRGFDYTLNITPDIGYVTDWYNYDLIRNGKKEHHTEYITDYLTDQSIDFIKQKAQESKNAQKPFFIWLAHVSPHQPTTPPVGSNRYALNQINLPPSSSDDLSTKPPIQAITRMHSNYLAFGENGIKNLTKNAYEVVSNLDDNVGKINKSLQDLGIKENTIIIYVSDNGLFYGEHQLYTKGPYMYEEQIKTPLLISYPKLLKLPQINKSLVSSLDLLPTILSILKIPNPPNIQGKSLQPILTGQSAAPIHNSLYLEMPPTSQDSCSQYPIYGVIMDGFKWIQYAEGKFSTNTTWDTCLPTPYNSYDGFDFELYDLNKDPLEMNNILKRQGPSDNAMERMLTDTTYGNTIQKLRKERAIWATNTNDPKRFILSDGKTTPQGATSIEVAWKVAAGFPTAEIEYQQKDCPSCPILQLDDFSHNQRPYKYTLTNLKPATTYKIRVFSFGARGVGGYIDLEGSTTGTVQPSSPSQSSCTSDSQCPQGQVCQQICTASFPPTCRSFCNQTITTSPNNTTGQTAGSSP